MSLIPEDYDPTTVENNANVSRALTGVTEHRNSLYRFINVAILSTIFCLLGMVTNMINIVVFYKHGMRSTVNISFIALSVTDLINVILTEWACIGNYLMLINIPDLVIIPSEINYLTGAFPHACVTRITAWITVYMTAERCCCIALPFKVKRLITPRKAIFAVITIYILNMVQMAPEFAFYKFIWKFSPVSNTTKLGTLVNTDNNQLEGLSFLLFTITLIISFILVIILTLTLIVQVQKMALWRSSSHTKGEQSKRLSRKDRMAVRTVLVVACVFIITNIPNFMLSWLCFVLPGFNMNGHLSEVFLDFASFVALFDSINASINAFFYCKMNSRYRQTLNLMWVSSWERYLIVKSFLFKHM